MMPADGLCPLGIIDFPILELLAHLTGNSVPALIGTGFTVMSKDNIDDPNVKKYVYTG